MILLSLISPFLSILLFACHTLLHNLLCTNRFSLDVEFKLLDMADVDASSNTIDYLATTDGDAEKGNKSPGLCANAAEGGPIVVEFEPGDPENPRNWSPVSESS